MLWSGELPFLFFWLLVAAFSLAVGMWARQRRPAPGTRTFSTLVLSLVIWSTVQVLHFTSASPALRAFWHKADFFAMVTVPSTWLAFALRYIQQDKPLTSWDSVLLAIEPAVTVLLIGTNQAHSLVWRSPANSAVVGAPGPWFWVHIAYANVLFFAGILLFVPSLARGSALSRRQGMALLLGVLLAWVGGILHYIFPALGPASFAVALLLFNLSTSWGLLQYRLFDLIPVARATVLEQMPDAVFLFDAKKRLVDCNRAAQRLLGQPASALIGKTSTQIFSDHRELITQYREAGELFQELLVQSAEGQRYYEVHANPLYNPFGEIAGHLLVMRDVTQRKQAQEALRQRNEELGSMYEIALELTAKLDLKQLLLTIVERTNHLLHGLGSEIYLYRPQSDDLEHVAASGAAKPFLGHVLRRGEGLGGKVLESGSPMTVSNYSKWPGRSPLFEEQEIGALLAVPIKWGEQMLGVLNLMRERDTPFSADDVRLLSFLANQAAIAIHNALIIAAETTQRHRAEALAQATAALTSTLELEPLLENVLRAAMQAIPAGEKGSILLVDEHSGELRVRALVGYTDKRIYHAHFVREEGYSYKALRKGRPLIIADATTDDIRYDGEIEEMRAIQSAIVTPLRYHERIIGVISLDNASRKAAFSEDDLALLDAFAGHAAVAITNACLYEAVQQELTERKRAEEELRRRSEQLATLHDLSLEVASQLDSQQLLPMITQQALQLLHADSADLYLYRPEHDDLQVAVVYGMPGEFTNTVLKRGEGLSGKVLQSGKAMAVADYSSWPGRAAAYEGQDFGAMVAAPIKWGEQILGTIDVARQSGPPFTEEEKRLLSLFANQVAVAIANARLYDATQRELAERRQAEAALRESEQRYRWLFESLREGIIITDERGYIVDANPAAAAILGFSSPQEIIGSFSQDLYSEPVQDQPWYQELMQKGYMDAMEMCMKRKDGTNVYILGGGVLRCDAEGKTLGAGMMFIDITPLKQAEEERKKLEEQLRQAQKMEALGLLAGGIAHEFNNLLTIIQGYAELALMALTPSQPSYPELLTICRTTERAAALTRQILTVSRRQILQRKALNLNTLVTDLSAMLQRLIGEPIELRTKLAPDLRPVLADSSAIEQVIINLTLNARDAMPQGGVLTIQTDPVTLDEAFCRTHPDTKPGEYVRLTVADTGIGMDKNTKDRIFEPFFTTKEVGKGTGLGLSMVYGLVKEHGGFIEVFSQVGQGTRIEVYLPVVQPEFAAAER